MSTLEWSLTGSRGRGRLAAVEDMGGGGRFKPSFMGLETTDLSVSLERKIPHGLSPLPALSQGPAAKNIAPEGLRRRKDSELQPLCSCPINPQL